MWGWVGEGGEIADLYVKADISRDVYSRELAVVQPCCAIPHCVPPLLTCTSAFSEVVAGSMCANMALLWQC